MIRTYLFSVGVLLSLIAGLVHGQPVQTAVLVGVNGYEPYSTAKSGRLTMNPDGSNGWDGLGKGHQYLVVKMPVSQVEALVNRLIQHQPVK